MLKVEGKVACNTVEVETDPYIPLTITWDTSSGQQPLYWRITGRFGGELEIKVDPQYGALMELIVIEEPPEQEMKLPRAPAPDLEHGVPTFDRSPWGISANPDYTEFRSRVATSNEQVTFSIKEGTAYLLFPSQEATHILVCGDTQVHISKFGHLAAVITRVST